MINKFWSVYISSLLMMIIYVNPSLGANNKNCCDELIQRLTTGESVTNSEILDAYETANEGEIYSLTNILIKQQKNHEVVRLLKDLWKKEKDKYPKLAWTTIDSPLVQIALAQTLGQIEPSNQEYLNHIRKESRSSNRMISAQAILGLGLIGKKDDIDEIVKFTKSTDQYISSTAIFALVSMRIPESNTAIEDLRIYFASDRQKQTTLNEALRIYRKRR